MVLLVLAASALNIGAASIATEGKAKTQSLGLSDTPGTIGSLQFRPVISDGGATPEVAPTIACPVVALPNDGGTSGNERAPNLRNRFGRSVYLILASEMAAAGFTNGTVIAGIGWTFTAAPGVSGSNNMTILMQNSADTTNTKSTTWATAISTMTTVHTGAVTVPNVIGSWSFPFAGAPAFTYTGGSLYVAFDAQYPVGTLSATTVVSCNSLSLVNGLLGGQGAAAPTTLTASSFRPETLLAASTGGFANDASVDLVYTLGDFPLGVGSPHVVRALVSNRGSNVQTNLPVTLDVTGANSFTDTQIVPSLAACGGTATVSFLAYTPGSLGSDTVTVSVPPDDNLAFVSNNSKSKPLDITPNVYSYKHPGSTADGGVGLNGAVGQFVARFTTTGATQVDSAILEFFAVVGTTYKVVIYGDDGTAKPGAQLYVDAVDRTVAAPGSVTIRLPAPVAVGPGNFFVGIQQTNVTNANFGFDNESPIRAGNFFFSTVLTGGPWTDLAPGNPFKLNVGAILGSCLAPMTVDVTPDGTTSVCAGLASIQYSAATAGGTGAKTYQWTEDGGDIGGATNTTVLVTKGAPGSFLYNCKVTDDGGCVAIVDAAASTGTWLPDAAPCEDGNPCTSPDVCGSGICQPGVNPCEDNDACTNDICDGPSEGSCTYTPVNCDDGNACTDDSCNSQTGCVHVNNTNLCSDGNPCTLGDACSGGVCVPGPAPQPVQFCNFNGITINDNTPPSLATPYPATVVVSGLGQYLCSTVVDIFGINHTFPDDIDILLDGAGPQNAIIMSDVGGGTAAVEVDLTLTDSAATAIPDAGPLGTGTFRPTNVNPGTGTEAWPGGAPLPLGGSALAIFTGTNPNGNWNLYVVDDEGGDSGSIGGGWCVTLAAVCGNDAECDDQNVCTGDACVSGACVHTNVANACDDQNACTSNDACVDGVCTGTAQNCDDLNTCTSDSCNTQTGQCVYAPSGICEDGDACTLDVCDPQSGCGAHINACTEVCGAGITILDAGVASPYPSTINVSGIVGAASLAKVQLNGLTHSFVGDVDMLLQGPGGNAIIMSDVGGTSGVTGVDLTLTDGATPLPAAAFGTGVWAPTNLGVGDTFAAPAPAPLGGSALSVFTGANGTWNLWVVDDALADTGDLAEWCLDFFVSCNNAADCDDGDPCTTDGCSGGLCTHTAAGTPAVISGGVFAADKATYSWVAEANSASYNVVRGLISALPVGPGDGDETCLGSPVVTSIADGSIPVPGAGVFYIVRGKNVCGVAGTYGFEGVDGLPAAERITTTCP